ncbi:MAG: hypothetical protein NTX41_06030 [Verrucomicrobia bacterium]|nr:hypothetical protein [Verrucomicrobiota bacterium]
MNENLRRKIPLVVASFWVMKITATTLGETLGDYLSKDPEGLMMGYAKSTALIVPILLAMLFWQISRPGYRPFVFWSVVLATSTVGTTLADLIDRTQGLGYGWGSALLVALLAAVFVAWRASGEPLSVDAVQSRLTEAYYWAAIVISNTLGTALGDYMAKDAKDGGLGLSVGASTLLIGCALFLLLLLWRHTALSRVGLFWAAFVLTRPFGATSGDFLAEEMHFGTTIVSLILALVLGGLVTREFFKQRAVALQS